MKLELLPMNAAWCEMVRYWRNESMETLRTPFPLTQEQQKAFYEEVCCNRTSPHRYWGIYSRDDPGGLVGMGGLTFIQWENSLAEISLITHPAHATKGIGTAAVDLLLNEAFNRMGLKTVYGECYHCNEAGGAFWSKIAARYLGFTAILPNRKFWDGKFWDSLYFSIDVDNWRQVTHV